MYSANGLSFESIYRLLCIRIKLEYTVQNPTDNDSSTESDI